MAVSRERSPRRSRAPRCARLCRSPWIRCCSSFPQNDGYPGYPPDADRLRPQQPPTLEDDNWDSVNSRIELTAAFGPEAFDGIEEFSHAEIVFIFDRARESA